MAFNWKFGKERNEDKKFSPFSANFPEGTEFPVGAPITEQDVADFKQLVDNLIESDYLDLDRLMSRYESSSSKEEFFNFINVIEKISEYCNDLEEQGKFMEEIEIVKQNLGIVDAITLYENLKSKVHEQFLTEISRDDKN